MLGLETTMNFIEMAEASLGRMMDREGRLPSKLGCKEWEKQEKSF